MRVLSQWIATLVCAICTWSLASVQARAGVIVGIDDINSGGGLGVLYTVDPMTGETTSLNRGSMGIPTSSSPRPFTFFTIWVNLYSNNLVTGDWVEYGCMADTSCMWASGDHAYDSARGSFFSIGTAPGGGNPGLFRMVDTGIMPFDRYELISYQWIGEFGSESIRVMEYVPGLGLYGVGGSNGYLIDEATGHATLLAPLALPLPPPLLPESITGLAYDAASGRLIGTTGSWGASQPAYVYSIDPTTGAGTLLNGNAPNLLGIATVGTPEPAVITMLALGLAFCIVASPLARRCR